IAQRATAFVLSVCVTVHLVTVILAVQHGLTAAEILERVGGSAGWLTFYSVFVLAAAVHAPLGIRTILEEETSLTTPLVNTLALIVAGLMLFTGLRSVFGLYGI
ncbi:MAG: succinate dehydrogenase, partial [Gammaproteobacteria bacterium]|nr:succinate dehydrogenase [Gammaproteobacteria bacterium]